MNTDPGERQSVLSLIFDFFKLVAAVILVLAGLFYIASHSDGPPLIQTVFETVSETLRHPPPWLGSSVMVMFLIAYVSGALIYSRQHPELGGFAKVLTKAGLHMLAVLVLLPIVAILGVVFYSILTS